MARPARLRPTDGVPTSYYATAQFTCRATIIDEPEAKAELLRRQMAHFQPDGDHAPIDPAGRPTGGCCSLLTPHAEATTVHYLTQKQPQVTI
ncbi:FMN-binding negative transcriptional regulator [Streptomyces sp. SID2563]|uniref:FMN-binding negative transcriptional regulator n=1 Tax=Streptomyces sp. SID2563 TaxID=2690255 RepID=UPI002351B783|nr:FMN-binding negative transcriptional regulator [Streptomyces sp. SID2563]